LISEGSCDTEDWIDDAENSALHQPNISMDTSHCYSSDALTAHLMDNLMFRPLDFTNMSNTVKVLFTEYLRPLFHVTESTRH